MKRYGLIGYPLGHSFSASYFEEKFLEEGIEGISYDNYPIADISDLPSLLEKTPLEGFNVTIPYKEAVIPYLDHISDVAAQIGAVNCVRVDNGKLHGYNTDAYGFELSLLEFIGSERPAALILGSGGASKAVQYVLRKLEMEYLIISTRPGRPEVLSYEELSEKILSGHRLIINTTPLGTFPNLGTAPDIPYFLLTESHYLYDVVYNPSVTKFMKLGLKRGAKICNGYRMLVLQAEKSWEIFNVKAYNI